MISRVIVTIIFFIILYCLGSGLYHLVRNESNSVNLVKALTWRIILSVSLFLFIFFAYFMGWLHPNLIMVAPPGA